MKYIELDLENSTIKKWKEHIDKNKHLSKDTPLLKDAPYSIKTDNNINLYALFNGNELFKNLNEDLKNDRNFILQIINREDKNSYYYYYPEKFKEDKEIITLSYLNNPSVIKYIPYHLKKEILPYLLSLNGMGLEFCEYQAMDNIKLSEIAVNQNVKAIKFVPKKQIVQISKNKNTLFNILTEYPEGFKYLSGYVRKNFKYALDAVKKFPDNIEYTYNNIKDDRDLAIELIQTFCIPVYHLSPRLHEDKELLLLSLTELKKRNQTYIPYYFLPTSLRQDIEFLTEAIKINNNLYRSLYDIQKKKSALILAFLPDDRWQLYLPTEIVKEIGNNDPIPYIQNKHLNEKLNKNPINKPKIKI